MVPTIAPGDRLEVRPVTPDHLRAGQVLLVERGDGMLIAHRLLEIAEGDLLLCGDNSLLCDRPEPMSGLLGQVSAIWRRDERIPLPLRVPFPTAVAPGPARAEMVYLRIAGPIDAKDQPCDLQYSPAEAEFWLRQRQGEGVPVLALAPTGRAPAQTLDWYAATYDRLVLVSGAIAGEGAAMQMSIPAELITEAIRCTR